MKALLKSFLRELPEPLFTRSLMSSFLDAQGLTCPLESN